MPTPAFFSVNFIDPWGSVPPGTFKPGVLCTVDDSTAPAGTVVVGRLLQGTAPLAYGTGDTAGFVIVAPPGPLTAALPYLVQVQWVQAGTKAEDADWTVAGIAQAPVVTSAIALSGGQVAAAATTLSWGAEGTAQPRYGMVRIYDVAAGSATAILLAPGGSGSTAFAFTPGKAYAAFASAVALIDPTVPNVYTTGPYAPPAAVPVDAPALTRVTYDGALLSVAWTAPALPTLPVVADPQYSLLLVSGGAVVARFPADAGGGSAAVDASAYPGGLSVAGQVRYGVVEGPVGTPQAVLPLAPSIAAVALAAGSTAGSTSVTVTTVPPPGLPSGAFVNVSLLRDGVAVSTGAAPASFSYDMRDGARYAVSARAVTTIGGTQAIYGPQASAPLVPAVVSSVTASYDGSRLALVWPPVRDPALTGYLVTLGGTVSKTLVTGPEPVLSLPAAFRVGDTATVTVAPLAGVVTGQGSTAVTYTVPAPAATAIGEVAVDGAEVSLAWAPSAGPWVDGYRVTVSGTGDGVSPSFALYTGLETSLRFSLPPQAVPVAWSVAVAPTAGGTAGTASPAVPLFPAVPVVTGVTVAGGTATVAWALAPSSDAIVSALTAAGASVRAQLLDAGNVVAGGTAAVSAATGTVEVTLPAAPTGRMTAAAQLAAAAQTGSRSGAVAVLAAPPSILYGDLADGGLRLRWSETGDAGVTGYRIAYAGATLTTAGTEAFLPLAPSAIAPGTVTLTPVGAGAAGPGAALAVIDAYTVQAGTYDGAALSVTLGGSPSTPPAQTWVEVVVDGAVAARTVVSGAPGGAVSVPVALRPGASAQVRATGVGAGPITPPGAAIPIPISRPSAVSAVWDGTSVHASWPPVPDPGVSGYLVTVAGASTTIPPVYVAGASSSSTAIAAAFPGAFPGSASVSVQAVAVTSGENVVAGPASIAAVPSLSGAVRAVAAAATAQPPYLYRRGVYQQLSGVNTAPVVVYLPNVFTASTPPEVKSADGVFDLKAVASPTAAGAAYSLTIDKSVWTTFGAEAARPALRSSYIAFLQLVEAAGVQPWGIGVVRQAIATGLPQTFAETLYYRYGLWQDASLRVVDLEPGLRLRVSGAVYQTASASTSDARNGFVALGTETYDLAQVFPAGTAQAGLLPALTVDAFLSRIFPGAPGTGSAVAGGPLDFFGVAGREAYFRIFYPPSFQGSGGIGVPSPTANVAIVGAASWTALESATSYYAQNAGFPPGAALFIAYFRGRAALTPLLQVELGGETRWVPVGTTLRQLLAQSGAAPAFGAGAGGAVTLARTVAGVYDFAQGGPPLRADAVDLSGTDLGSLQPQLWPLDVPLLGGDQVRVTPAGGPAA